MLRIALLTSALLLAQPAVLAAAETPARPQAAKAGAADPALASAIAGDWRDPKNSVRDLHRHPAETLAFFGLRADQRVIEITPGGGGWYAEILAPYLRDKGVYTAAMVDPGALGEGRGRDYQQKSLDDLKARFAGRPPRFDKAAVVVFDPAQPRFGEPGSADVVLTFRNVHNWTSAGTADGHFNGFFDVLKPGGVLGVVDHRARPGTDAATMKDSGYVTEALVIELATKAGFVLDARSEVNANPKDTTDHPEGVWTLPPTNRHDAEDAQKYREIGESDRMTLRFVKPAVGAALDLGRSR